jgi:hypothetical protein
MNTASYQEFLEQKAITDPATGLVEVPALNPMLFEYQQDIVRWALKRGRAAIWADCGLGKGPMALEWAKHVPGPVLIIAPLAVSQQFVREAEKFGVEIGIAKRQEDITCRITVTNYERFDAFDMSYFKGVVLDESSILKAHDGKTRSALIDAFKNTPFRLCCTATPAPNDHMELGNHAEFLGTMSRVEMLSMFFVHDGGDTAKWRLKGHAQSEFWKWMASWAVMIRKPSDLGYSDEGFNLPELHIHQQTVAVEKPTSGMLFAMEAQTLQERLQARRDTIEDRVADAAKIIICDLIGSRDKLAENDKGENQCRGSQNMQREEKSDTQQAKTNEIEESLKGEHQKKTENTCASITEKTKTTEKKELLSKSQNTTRPEGKDIRTTTNSGSDTSFSQEVDAKRQDSTHGLNHHSESQKNNTTNFSANKMEYALSVAQAKETSTESDSMLTTAILQDVSGDFSAQTVILDLESLTTILKQLDAPQSTLSKWVVWCNLNSEQELLEKLLRPHVISITGSMSTEEKEIGMLSYMNGEKPILLTKPTIAGFGLNLQFCNNMAFVGLSDSYEQFYQAVRRCWRFGQTKPVNIHIITAETEGAVVANIKRKEQDAMTMADNMVQHMKDINTAAIHGATVRDKSPYVRDVVTGNGWTAHLGDCVDVASELPTDSLHYTVYSPPFARLYTYSNSDRDMGNCTNYDEFFTHYKFLVKEIFRATMPGRLVSFHCMNLPTSKERHGFIGIQDFRGDLIRLHQEAGFIFHSEVCIWKDPVTAMQRTKALGLLHKQIRKDSCMSRQGIPDYLVTMRKPGDNPERVSHTPEDFPVSLWQRYASPVWMDINPSDTLQYRSAREHNDERHICPLQLDVIRRALKLWSNPGDLVFSPFMGIGSEGFVAIQEGRRFVGSELKRSYFEQSCRNLACAVEEQKDLFSVSDN